MPEPSRPGLGGAGGPSKYVPPSMRNRGDGDSPAGDSMDRGRDRRDDFFTVRVSNLSEDANEEDLHALFRKVGHIARVFCSRDKETGLCRGFAFVSFYSQGDAERAIQKLNGHGYDNLILRVEMAQEWVVLWGGDPGCFCGIGSLTIFNRLLLPAPSRAATVPLSGEDKKLPFVVLII